MQWYLAVLKNYTGFSGRARRLEFWMFALINAIIGIILDIIQLWAEFPYPYLSALYGLAVLLPAIAVSVRRLHDTDRSGWWLLLAFIPVIGPIILLVFYCQSGTSGINRFGDDPELVINE
ncbi:DUF805 domain-containing protein [Escherichia coli]|uniref:DUF805 domain-containing protein n=1 Tax=Escherichia coli TaxID=562 RepID=UPI0017EF4C01|nr:DUF805 domain-containing protein [Escherichia coli]